MPMDRMRARCRMRAAGETCEERGLDIEVTGAQVALDTRGMHPPFA
jgi:hypothetical protein